VPLPKDVPVDPCREVPDVGAPKVDMPPDEVAQNAIVLLGGGTVINGLIPPLMISVAPMGIVLLPGLNPWFDPGVDNGDALPLEDIIGVVQPDADAIEPVPLNPPPSKVELGLELLAPSMLREDKPGDEQSALGVGLNPPGSISVAPKGMPVLKLELLDPGMPSGDVVAIPGVPFMFWAWLAP
jgi:hypothetical protein